MYAELFDRSLDKRIDFTEFILIPETEIYFWFSKFNFTKFFKEMKSAALCWSQILKEL